ncbi:FHA domain-containing protein [Cystobacter fuscus]|uniref:FHA domain-containing protein n=2 Tax=Cystobacter fuscus TaxID=43 RepID=A0A250J7G2_9BACT|nr:FHA domain-containing protein [Cystobacter fuscus]
MVANAGQRLIVEVRWGANAGRKAVVEPGRVLRVGRAEPAQLVVADDTGVSAPHFELAWDGATCRLKHLASGADTLLDGQRVDEAEVSHGAWVRAGQTDFSVYFECNTPPPPPAGPESAERLARKARALEVLSGLTEPLFAVLDAARDERIPVLLRESVEEYRSLYEGAQGEAMAEIAPYVVHLPGDSRLLRSLVQEGWGRNWGIFLSSQRPFKDVRRHLRKFLMVKDSVSRDLYFRFYDPRVLRVFLPTSWPEQNQALFEGVRAYWAEGDDGTSLLRFALKEQALHRELVPLDESPA